jgi:hypothetical protein
MRYIISSVLVGCRLQSWPLGVTCGCLSSVEVALEAAEVAVQVDLLGIEIVTCGCLSIVEVGAEAAVVGAVRLGCEIVTRVVSPFQRLVQRPQELLLAGWVVRLLPAAVCPL